MLKVYLALGCALVVVGLSVVVQNKDVSTYRVWSAVDSVSASPSEGEADIDGAWDLWVNGSHGDACALALQSEIARYPQNIDIQLYREIPSTANCDGDEAIFERRLSLTGELVAGQPPYLIINSQVWAISYPAGKADGLPVFEAQELLPVHVEQAGLVAGADAAEPVELRIRAVQAIGCDAPELYSMRESAESVLLGVFNAIAADTVCPAMLVPVDEKVTLPATDAGSDALFKLNAIPINELETPEMTPIDKVLTNILDVTVEIEKSDATRVSLDVQGEHPDGCDFPVIVNQARQGNSITVEVYREVPVDMFCPMILKPYRDTIRLEGDFAPGEYIINVNTYTQTLEI
ncbi:MAG: hypothetical protein OXE52_05520 [Chloroflexi bacterium]|nr:hypothetical protein [Chloroflexota bacterium]